MPGATASGYQLMKKNLTDPEENCSNNLYMIRWENTLAAILDFRHEVASAIIAGYLDVSYIVVNPWLSLERHVYLLNQQHY